MNKRIVGVALLALAACGQPPQQETTTATPVAPSSAVATALAYPVTATVAQTDDFFGTSVADPYR